MATRGDEIYLSYGVMGGFMQPQGHVQVLLNLLRGFTVQASLDAPRFCIGAGMPDNGAIDSSVFLEEGISEDVVQTLKGMGHNVTLVKGWSRGQFGRGQVIQRIERNGGKKAWAAGSDPRADGAAVPQV
jgi:gamma-glutamyltranspeptidase / glutathione hydrolase